MKNRIIRAQIGFIIGSLIALIFAESINVLNCYILINVGYLIAIFQEYLDEK